MNIEQRNQMRAKIEQDLIIYYDTKRTMPEVWISNARTYNICFDLIPSKTIIFFDEQFPDGYIRLYSNKYEIQV